MIWWWIIWIGMNYMLHANLHIDKLELLIMFIIYYFVCIFWFCIFL